MTTSFKYFVVSLPRSGTSSIAQMANICGLRSKHCPFIYFDAYLQKNNYDFYSDTPVYVPSIVKKLCHKDNVKFIYIDRPYAEIFDSWTRCGLFRTYNSMIIENKKNNITKGRLFDFQSYNESFGEKELSNINYIEIFAQHKQIIIDLIQTYNKKLLIYKFSDGWESFCDFLQVKVPNVEIPKLNCSKR